MFESDFTDSSVPDFSDLTYKKIIEWASKFSIAWAIRKYIGFFMQNVFHFVP